MNESGSTVGDAVRKYELLVPNEVAKPIDGEFQPKVERLLAHTDNGLDVHVRLQVCESRRDAIVDVGKSSTSCAGRRTTVGPNKKSEKI